MKKIHIISFGRIFKINHSYNRKEKLNWGRGRLPRGAFTLVELITVLVILAILSTILFVTINGYLANTRDAKRYSDITELYEKIQNEIVLNSKLDVKDFITGAIFQSGNIIVRGKTYSGLLIGEIDFDILKESKKNFQENLSDLEDYKMIIIPNTNYYAIIASRETENMIPEQNTFITEDEKNKMIVGNFIYNQLAYVEPDNCPEGDYSGNEYDGDCGTPPIQVTYSWEIGEYGSCENLTCSSYSGFGECSKMCGGGLQINTCNEASGTKTREVKCKSSNQEIVSDGFCNEIKPETNANCTTTENLMAFNQEQNCNTEICADCSSYTLVSCPTNANCSQCTEGVGANNKWKVNSCKEHYSGTNCEIADTKTFTCSEKPANSDWNTVSSYTQTWNGSTFAPADSTATYNTTASTESCRYKCATSYIWDGDSCESNLRTQACNTLTTGEVRSSTSTSGNKNITQTTTNLSTRTPTTTKSYNTDTTTNACYFKCTSGYTRQSSSCVANSCASYTSGNGTFTTGTPTAPNTIWQTTNSSQPCYVSCSSGYSWSGTKCDTIGYTITYNGDGGTLSSCSPTTYTIASSAITPTCETKTRAGYTFNSFSPITIPTGSIGDKIVTANWTAISYTITIDENGGGAVPDLTYTTSTSLQTKTLTVPTRAGYTFSNWTISTQPTGGTATVSSNTLTIPANAYGAVIVKANWNINSYTLTVTSGTPTSATQNYGTTLSVTASAGTTYTVSYNVNGGTSTTPSSSTSTKPFSSWTLSGGGTVSSTTTSPTTYTFGTANGALTANYGTQPAVTLPAAPTRTGYTFNGWYTATSGGTKRGNAGATYTPTASETLYAQWTVNSYTLTVTSGTPTSATQNYGTTLSVTASAGTTYTVSYNVNGGTSTTPSSSTSTKPFSSWTLSGGGTVSSTTTSPTTYTFGTANGALTANYGTQPAVTLPAAPTRTGYTFNGWYTATSGGTKRGNAGATYTPTASETLYAQWTESIVQFPDSINLGAIQVLSGPVTLSTKYDFTTGSKSITLQPNHGGNIYGAKTVTINITTATTGYLKVSFQSRIMSKSYTFYIYIVDGNGSTLYSYGLYTITY